MNIGFVPLRKGSKGIPGKNKRKLLGRPLFCWTLAEAIKSSLDHIYVYTDDSELIEYINAEYKYTNKVTALNRLENNATDVASTELAISDFLDSYEIDFTTFTLLQATSPLTTAKDINRSLDKIINEHYDSCLSAVRTKRFLWNQDGKSINYDYLNRPRRQDFDGVLIENGAVYTTTKTQYQKNKNRIGGKIAINEMEEDTLVEIDEESDFSIIEHLLAKRLRQHKQSNQKIKTIVLDVDGIFTNGRVIYGQEGELGKTFNMRDGMALENLDPSISIYVLTSENSQLVKKRMEKLKLKNVFLGVKDKYLKLDTILEKENLSRSEIAYLGDDVNDLANILSCGWGICPSDATLEVKKFADLELSKSGGDMAIRNAIEFITNFNQRFK